MNNQVNISFHIQELVMTLASKHQLTLLLRPRLPLSKVVPSFSLFTSQQLWSILPPLHFSLHLLNGMLVSSICLSFFLA